MGLYPLSLSFPSLSVRGFVLPHIPVMMCHRLEAMTWLIMDGNCEVRLTVDRNLRSREAKQMLSHGNQASLVFVTVVGSHLTQQGHSQGDTWWLPLWKLERLGSFVE